MRFDRVLIFLLSYYPGFVVSVLGLPLLSYAVARYSISYVLVIAILYKLGTGGLPAGRLAAGLAVGLACAIEYLHFLTKGTSLDGLTDIRMVLYNPLYSSVILFVLYATYLLLSTPQCRRFHLNYSVRLLTLLNGFYILFWLVLATGRLPIYGTDYISYLNNNHVSYIGLTIVFILLRYPQAVDISPMLRRWCLWINVAVMTVNTTRGALLILVLILGYHLFAGRSRVFSTSLKWGVAGITALLCLTSGALLDLHTKILGSGFSDLYDIVKGIEIDTKLEGKVLDVERGDTYDDFSVSSVARIYANYVGMAFLLDYPVFGIGSALAYSIKVMGDGIHAFVFLYPVATGFVGTALLVLAIWVLQRQFGTQRLLQAHLLLVLPVLVFMNYLPTFFVLLFIAASTPGAQFAAVRSGQPALRPHPV
jgi:hypothetical protein